MQVAYVFGPNDLRLHEVAAPRAGPRDVVLQVASVGICGSDLGYVAAGGVSGPASGPFPIGHELSGLVAEVGAEVTSLAVGDRVILNPLVNAIGNGGPEGGFAERLLVRDIVGRPESLIRLPDAVSLETGALVEPLAVGAHAVRRLGAKPGDKVAVFGAGPIGLAAIVALRGLGVDDIVAVEPSAFRRERAVQLGATEAIDPRQTAAAEALMARHGATKAFRADAPGTTHFLEASGAPSVLPEIIGFAQRGAFICIAAAHKKPAELDLMKILAKEITLTGALGYPTELGEVIETLSTGVVDLAPFVSHRFAGTEFLEAFDVARRADSSAKVLVRYATASD